MTINFSPKSPNPFHTEHALPYIDEALSESIAEKENSTSEKVLVAVDVLVKTLNFMQQHSGELTRQESLSLVNIEREIKIIAPEAFKEKRPEFSGKSIKEIIHEIAFHTALRSLSNSDLRIKSVRDDVFKRLHQLHEKVKEKVLSELLRDVNKWPIGAIAFLINSGVSPSRDTPWKQFFSQEHIFLLAEEMRYSLAFVQWVRDNCLEADDPFAKLIRPLVNSGYPLIQLAFCLPEEKDHLFEMLKLIEDKTSFEIAFKFHPKFGEFCSFKFIKTALQEGHLIFVNEMLKHGMNLSQQQFDELLPLALKTYNLLTIKQFTDYAQVRGIKSPQYPQVLTEDKTDNFQNALTSYVLYSSPEDIIELAGLIPNLPEIDFIRYARGDGIDSPSYPTLLNLEMIKNPQHTLTCYALHSPLEDVYHLCSIVPAFQQALPAVLETISLSVRLPNRSIAKELNARFEDIDIYVNKTESYALQNKQFLETLPPLFSMSRKTFFDSVVKDRYERMEHKNSSYISKAMDRTCFIANNRRPKTPFFTRKEDSDTKKQEGSPTRYHWSLRHLTDLIYNPATTSWQIPDGVSMQEKDNAIYFTYHVDRLHHITVTKVERGETESWTHNMWGPSEKSTFKALDDHLEGLQKDIAGFPLNLNDPKNKAEFFKKVARGYWLTATLCEYERGTPHNAMMWLNKVYRDHRLPPPIPKIEHFYLDNTMLNLPIEVVIEKWTTFFEPTFQEYMAKTSDVTIH